MINTASISPEDQGPSLEEEASAQEAAKAAAEGEEPKLAGEGDTPDRPEWLPEKFASPEDMAKAYAELEKGKSQPKEEAAATDEAAESAVSEAGLNMDALSTEYAEKGELTPESLEALGKVGITPDMVDAYIAGQTAQADALKAAVLEPVGSEEAYNEMVAWAADNMAEAEIDTFNAVLENGDINGAKMAIENLSNKYKAANGSEPSRQLNGKAVNSSGGVYESTQDLMKDMGNPEYAKNPAFRAKVEAKLSRSNIM